MNKKELREEMLHQRALLSIDERNERSEYIQNRFSTLLVLSQGDVVGLYSPCKGEVETSLTWLFLKREGVKVVFPKVEGEELKFYSATKKEDLERGRWGILEPKFSCEKVDISEIDYLVIPGLAFGRNGHRVGYGRGYYDRVLKNFKGRSFGFAFDFQIVPDFESQVWDEPCDFVITEHESISCSS